MVATATIGTIPALTEWQPGAVPLTGDERFEIVSTGSATTAASYQMRMSNIPKVAGVLPAAIPGTDDLMMFLDTTSGQPRSTLVGNIGVLSGGNMPAGGNTGQLLGKLSATSFDANWLGSNSSSVIYVAKNGTNTSDGIFPWLPKLTIQAAVTAAEALIAAGASAAQVNVLDTGTYVEDLVQSTGILLWAPGATLVGTLSLNVGSYTRLYKHYPGAATSVMVDLSSDSGDRSVYQAVEVDGRGTTGALAGSTLFRNRTSGRIFVATADVAIVPQNGVGVVDGAVAAGFGHIHCHFADLYLAGDSAVGVLANNATSNIIGYIDHILEIGTPANTVGVSITNATAVVKLTVSELIADTAYTVAGSTSFYMQCPRIEGTRVGTANLAIVTPSAASA